MLLGGVSCVWNIVWGLMIQRVRVQSYHDGVLLRQGAVRKYKNSRFRLIETVHEIFSCVKRVCVCECEQARAQSLKIFRYIKGGTGRLLGLVFSSVDCVQDSEFLFYVFYKGASFVFYNNSWNLDKGFLYNHLWRHQRNLMLEHYELYVFSS